VSTAEAATTIRADWLDDPCLHRLFAAIAVEGDACWVVGGAVRNALLDRPAGDIDVATTALPEVVSARARAAGLKSVPTGIEHGTITVVVESRPFEVTTLRQDIETDGRHAVVRFGRDRGLDAHRRDFTMNALYAGLDGRVFDDVGGVADCHAGRVRFIGAAATRIAEDRLRILRFFRFHAAYGHGVPDAEGLHAAIVARDGLFGLSAERIGQEMTKLVVAGGAAAALRVMSDAGLLQRVLGRAADLGGFSRLAAFAEAEGAPGRTVSEAPLWLSALAGWVEGDALALAERLRLSNAARDRMVAAVRLARRVVGASVADLLHAGGRDGARDAAAIAHARGQISAPALVRRLAEIEGTEPPELPISGRDVIALGVAPGREVGRILAVAEVFWRTRGFAPDRAALLALCAAEIAKIRDVP
jgi:poly(A) polymerase